MNPPAKEQISSPSIKTPQELVHIKHKITLRQYKYWILALRSYREGYEKGISPDESGFHRLPVSELTKFIGYEPVKAELRADLEAIRKEAIIYNFLGKDGQTTQRGSGFISEWEVSSNWIGFKLPTFLAECIERLDLKNAIFQSLNWAVFNSFSGKYEAILYKLCKDYVGIQRTPYMEIEKFREYMGLSEGEYGEFKDLNKFVITGPLKKINESEVADITIDVEFKKAARRVIGLHFTVALRQQSALDLGIDPVFGAARVTISLAQQRKYLSEKPPAEIALSIERANTYADEQEAKGEAINLGAIYQTAITQDWGREYQSRLAREDDLREKKQKKSAAPKKEKQAADAGAADDREGLQLSALATYDTLPDADKDLRWQDFLAANPGADKAYGGAKRAGVVARKALGVWLAKQLQAA